jgi:Protein of unknown function (DUF1064)
MSLRVTPDEYKMLQARVGKGQSDSRATPVAKANKYHAVRKEVGGMWFHSTGEAKRYGELHYMQSLGVISELQLQVLFPLHIEGHAIEGYKADFVYVRDGRLVVEDFKGFRTKIYEIKRVAMKALYDIEILETSSRR